MAEVLLFHHVQGLTAGVHAIADALREAGHTVHTPDFFEGQTFGALDDGFAALKAKDPALYYCPDYADARAIRGAIEAAVGRTSA